MRRAASSVSPVAANVAMDGMKEPHRRIRGVIQPFARAVREHVRDQPVAHVERECAQDVGRLPDPPGRERQPLEADHRVAAPVGEPVIAGNHRPHVFAGGTRPRRFLGAAGWRDDELIRRQHQLAREGVVLDARCAIASSLRRRSVSASAAASAISASITSHDSVDATSVTLCDSAQIGAEIARAPQRPDGRVAAVCSTWYGTGGHAFFIERRAPRAARGSPCRRHGNSRPPDSS